MSGRSLPYCNTTKGVTFSIKFPRTFWGKNLSREGRHRDFLASEQERVNGLLRGSQKSPERANMPTGATAALMLVDA